MRWYVCRFCFVFQTQIIIAIVVAVVAIILLMIVIMLLRNIGVIEWPELDLLSFTHSYALLCRLVSRIFHLWDGREPPHPAPFAQLLVSLSSILAWHADPELTCPRIFCLTSLSCDGSRFVKTKETYFVKCICRLTTMRALILTVSALATLAFSKI